MTEKINEGVKSSNLDIDGGKPGSNTVIFLP